MNNLEIIDEREVLGKEFRIYGTFENPLFLAKDVAEWIDYAFKDSRKINRDVSKMLKTVDDDEKQKNTIRLGGEDYSHGGLRENTEMWFLTEDGLYEVLMQSRKPIAKQFKKKVKEILKGLRKGELTLQLSERDNAILNIMNATNDLERVGALRQFENIITKPLIDKNEELTEEIEVLTPKADIFDKFINSNGLYSSTQVAKLFKLSSAQKLNKMLNEAGLIYKQGKSWLPYATTDDAWFKLIVGETNGNNYSQLKITPKGVIEISKLLEIDVDKEELENLL